MQEVKENIKFHYISNIWFAGHLRLLGRFQVAPNKTSLALIFFADVHVLQFEFIFKYIFKLTKLFCYFLSNLSFCIYYSLLATLLAVQLSASSAVSAKLKLAFICLFKP